MSRRSNIIFITVVFIAFFLLCLALTACVPSLETDSSNALPLETGNSNLEEIRGIDPKVEQNIAKIDSKLDDETSQLPGISIPGLERKEHMALTIRVRDGNHV